MAELQSSYQFIAKNIAKIMGMYLNNTKESKTFNNISNLRLAHMPLQGMLLQGILLLFAVPFGFAAATSTT